MAFDCDQCRPRCKADCCRGPVPIPRSLLEKRATVRPVIFSEDMGGGMVMVLAEDKTKSTVNARPMFAERGGETIYGCCPFLGFDNKCSVYEDRPEVCREFGSESHMYMRCSYQAADGRVRSRQERRRVEAEQAKTREHSLRDMRKPSEQLCKP